MGDLPEGAPAALGWFFAWVFMSLLVSQLVGLFKDSDGQLKRRAQRKADRARDTLNTHLVHLLRPPSPPEDDPHLEQPVRGQDALKTLRQLTVDAWNPLRRHDLLAWASDTARFFCGIHALAVLPMGLSWWFTSGNDIVTKASIAVFLVFLLPIAYTLVVQLSCRFTLGMSPDE